MPVINFHESFVPVIDDNNSKITYFEGLMSVQLTNSSYQGMFKTQ